MSNWHYGMGLGMVLWWLLVFGILALAIYGLSGFFKNSWDRQHHHIRTNPLDTLKERFAKGEINEQEYEDKKRLLLKE